MEFTRVVGWLCAVLSCGTSALAQEIVIGHVAGYTGPVSKDAVEMGAGARVLIEAANARGGVLGKKLRLLAVDDQFKPEETMRALLALNGKAVALLPAVGSANISLVLKEGVLDRINLPIMGIIPALESFRF